MAQSEKLSPEFTALPSTTITLGTVHFFLCMNNKSCQSLQWLLGYTRDAERKESTPKPDLHSVLSLKPVSSVSEVESRNEARVSSQNDINPYIISISGISI